MRKMRVAGQKRFCCCSRERFCIANPASFGQQHARQSFLNILTSFFIDFATAAALYQNTAARDNNAVNNATPCGGRGVAKIPFVTRAIADASAHTRASARARLLQKETFSGLLLRNEHVLQGHDTLFC